MEIDAGTLEIRQWYGAHDKKPDRENMERWLDNYAVRLKCRPAGRAEQAAGVEQRALA